MRSVVAPGTCIAAGRSAVQRSPGSLTMATSAQAIEIVPEKVSGPPFTFAGLAPMALSFRPITW